MPRNWVGLGNTQEVSGDRQARARDEFGQRLSYAEKSQTHLWIVTLVHYGTDTLLDAVDHPEDRDNLPMLDMDTLSQPPLIGCYICEQSYEPKLRRRRCPGDPS